MITFDSKGNLQAGEPIDINLGEFEQHFVFNLHRRQQFEQYLLYLEALKTIVSIPFEQWVDGSFATLKEKPNDIDVVTFVPFEVYVSEEKRLAAFKRTFYPILDLYHVCDYEKNHSNFVYSQSDRIEWLHLFSRIRGQKLNKGFIKIYF